MPHRDDDWGPYCGAQFGQFEPTAKDVLHPASQLPPPAADANSASESSIFPEGAAGSVICTQLSAFSTTLTSMPSGTGMPCSLSTAAGSAINRAFKASSFQQAAKRSASLFFSSVIRALIPFEKNLRRTSRSKNEHFTPGRKLPLRPSVNNVLGIDCRRFLNRELEILPRSGKPSGLTIQSQDWISFPIFISQTRTQLLTKPLESEHR